MPYFYKFIINLLVHLRLGKWMIFGSYTCQHEFYYFEYLLMNYLINEYLFWIFTFEYLLNHISVFISHTTYYQNIWL